jgi:hypothetical protein
MPIRGLPKRPPSHPSTGWSRSPGIGGRDQWERLVAINWNRWSRSIRIGGRDRPVRARLASGKARWVERSKENHFLDLEAMQMAAAEMLNVQRMSGAIRPQPPKAPPEQTPETGPEIGGLVERRRDRDPREYHRGVLEARQSHNLDQGRWSVTAGSWLGRDR